MPTQIEYSLYGFTIVCTHWLRSHFVQIYVKTKTSVWSDVVVCFVLVSIIFILFFLLSYGFYSFIWKLYHKWYIVQNISYFIWNFQWNLLVDENETKKEKKKNKTNLNKMKHTSKFECAQLVGISVLILFFGVGVNCQCINVSSKIRKFPIRFGYLIPYQLLNFVVLKRCVLFWLWFAVKIAKYRIKHQFY